MKASECKCCKCGKQAVAFWPVVDPDIPATPYCQGCLDSVRIRVLMKVFDKFKEEAVIFVKGLNDIER